MLVVMVCIGVLYMHIQPPSVRLRNSEIGPFRLAITTWTLSDCSVISTVTNLVVMSKLCRYRCEWRRHNVMLLAA